MMEMDFESQQTAQAQLEPGERLLWYGKPDPRRGLLVTIPLMLFAIPWTGFSLFWMAAASGFAFVESEPGWDSLFALFGVPFVLVGLGLLTSPYWLYKKAKLTVYALTNRRAMIITGHATRKIQSFAGGDIGLIERTERANGRGDVIFATVETKKNSQQVGFMGISDARRVERLLLDVFKKEKEVAEPTRYSNLPGAFGQD
ncbi:MAG TPA: hypothetical protein VJZ26_02750 [Blastocatellia bacterium]|nr:hypothetical protein [Blastocatellia bacterium]